MPGIQTLNTAHPRCAASASVSRHACIYVHRHIQCIGAFQKVRLDLPVHPKTLPLEGLDSMTKGS